MTTIAALPTCWIIDHNKEAAASLRQLLETEGLGCVLGASDQVAGLPPVDISCLFIRITAWEEYLHWRRFYQRSAADTIIFLSGRFEKSARHLREDLDFLLRPPYRASQLGRVMRRRTDPGFLPRSVDLFFLNIRYRFQVVYFSDLWYIEGNGGGTVHVHTAGGRYTVSGTLEGFQRRLPIPWQRANRSLLVAQFREGIFTPNPCAIQ